MFIFYQYNMSSTKHTSLKVYDKACNECLFSKRRIVDEARAKQLIADALEQDSFFICHKSTIRDEVVCCRAFYEQHRCDTVALRLATLLNGVEFVPLPEAPKPDA